MKSEKYIFNYDMLFMNVISVILMVIMGIITYFIHSIGLVDLSNIFDFFVADFIYFYVYLIIIILWMVLHEIIHGTFYILNGANRKNIFYGVVLEKGIFYCKCGEFVNKKNIMMSVIAPFVLIGVITYILGILIKSPFLILLSFLNISGCSGDLMMFFFFLKRDKDVKFKELEDSATFCLETSEDLSNKKFLGVKLVKKVENSKEIEEERDKIITISKGSVGFLIFMGVIFAICLVALILSIIL